MQQQIVREYETVYILRPTTSASDAEKIASKAEEVISRMSGKLLELSNTGKKRLAHPIAKASRGYLTHLRYIGAPGIVKELERNLRLIDNVVRAQSIMTNEDVDLGAIKVDPEAIKFKAVDASEDDYEPTLEERLGLAGSHRMRHHEADPVEEEVEETEAAPEAEAAAEPS